MKWISYSRFSEEDLGVDVEDLLKALSDFLLESGFQDPYMQFSEMNQHTLENLKQAIERALESGEMFDQERAEEIRQRLQQMSAQQREKLMHRLIEKLEESGYINTEGPPPDNPTAPAQRADRKQRCTSKSPTRPSTFSASRR